MMTKLVNATERSDLHHRLIFSAIKAANSQSVSDVKRCFDILRHLKSMNLSVKELCHSKAILPLERLRHHGNAKIRMEVNVLFNSWMKTLYSDGRDVATCIKALPLKPKKADVVKIRSELKKKQHMQRSHAVSTPETKRKTEFLVPKKNKDDRSKTRETIEIKQNLKKSDVCKSVPATSRPLQIKKQPPLKVSENPRSRSHEVGEIKQNLKKVSKTSKYCPALKKNSREMLELFEIAKKSADVANTKGLLAAQAEASICVDTLTLLIDFPISSTATETRRIMMRLEHLTKHKDRKICNSASALLHRWRQSIKDQELRESRKSQGYVHRESSRNKGMKRVSF